MKEIDELVAISRKYGSDSRFVIAGGGNTSYKNDSLLFVKASGHALATISEDGFAILDRSSLNSMSDKKYSSEASKREEQVKNDLANANLTKDRRPSVETSLHNCMGYSYVVHLHPTMVCGLVCSAGSKALTAQLFPDALYVEYTDPGYTLFKKVYDKIKAFKKARGYEPKVIFLQNHGIFVAADTTAEIDDIYSSIMLTLSSHTGEIEMTTLESDPAFVEFVPALRSVLSRGGRGLKTLRVTHNSLTEYALNHLDQVLKPFTPDGIVYCKSEYIYLDDTDVHVAQKKIETYVSRRGHTPKVLLVKGVGLIAVGNSAKNAKIVTEVFLDAIKIAIYASGFGGTHPMTPRQIAFIDNWEVENYRRSVGTSASGRLMGRTIIVTGAAQGYGEGIARSLVKQGANIIVADLNEEHGLRTAESFRKFTSTNEVSFVKVNVADLDSVRSMMAAVIRMYGCIDVFVSNAGVLRAGGLDALTEREFDFVTDINYKGFFLCSKVASRIMKIQTSYDPEYYADIVQINSKSGLRGSKANFAYAGSKFGGIGLTQSFALELAPYHVKVNAVCPGNYYDGPLWSDPVNGLFLQYLKVGKVSGAKTVEDVKKFYISQVPMRKGCDPADVALAIMYAIEQTGETGQAITVTGGQIM